MVSSTEDGGFQTTPEYQTGLEKADRSGPAAYASGQDSRLSAGASGTVGVSPTLHAPGASDDILGNMETQLRAIKEQAGDDPISLSRGLAEFNSNIAMKQTDIYKETQSLMAARYGVPQLNKALQEAIRLDDATPGFRQKYGATDSAETGAIRSQLNQAMAASDGAINEALKGNTTYVKLGTAAITLGKTAEALMFKNLAKDEQKTEAAQEAYDRYNPEQKAIWDTAIGNTGSDPRMAVAHFAALPGAGRKALNDVVEGGQQAIPSLTLDGNPFAKRVAIANDTQTTGDPLKSATRIEGLMSIAGDNATALDAYAKLKANGSISAIDAKTLDLQMKTGLSSSSNKEESAKLRKFVALKVARLQTTQEFNSDVTMLKNDIGIQMPAFIANARNSPAFTNKRITLNDAITIANSAPSTAERQANINALTTYYSAAVNKQNKSGIFTVDPLSTEQIKAKAVLQGFNLFGKIANIPSAINEAFPMPEETRRRLAAVQTAAQSLADSNKGFFFGYPDTP